MNQAMKFYIYTFVFTLCFKLVPLLYNSTKKSCRILQNIFFSLVYQGFFIQTMIFILIPPLSFAFFKHTLSHESNTKDNQKVRMLSTSEIVDWSYDCIWLKTGNSFLFIRSMFLRNWWKVLSFMDSKKKKKIKSLQKENRTSPVAVRQMHIWITVADMHSIMFMVFW